ncbi:MAG: GGDEF domain-containing protein, partial [Deferribacterales bacterium]
VTTNIRTKKLYDYLESINTELYKLATTDPLTGLYNRRFILEQLTMLNYNFKRYDHNFTIMIMDIDKFKSINDTYGHDAGDMVIIDFANRVKESLRKTDYVGRFGGEELIVILQHINEENSISLTRKILETLRKSEVKYGEFTIRYTASIGVKYCNLYFEKIDEYIKKADQLLYMAKEKGRNRAFVDTGINVMEVV